MAQIIVDYTALADMAQVLLRVKAGFDGVEGATRSAGDYLGAARVSDSVETFGKNWSTKRAQISTLIEQVAAAAANAAQTYKATEDGIVTAEQKLMDSFPAGWTGGADPVAGPTDTDGDGTPDYRDTDSDNDGIPDAQESGLANPPSGSTQGADPVPVDTDGDGTPDYRDTDSNNDGVPDSAGAPGGINPAVPGAGTPGVTPVTGGVVGGTDPLTGGVVGGTDPGTAIPTGTDPTTGMPVGGMNPLPADPSGGVIAGFDDDGDGIPNSVEGGPTTTDLTPPSTPIDNLNGPTPGGADLSGGPDLGTVGTDAGLGSTALGGAGSDLPVPDSSGLDSSALGGADYSGGGAGAGAYGGDLGAGGGQPATPESAALHGEVSGGGNAGLGGQATASAADGVGGKHGSVPIAMAAAPIGVLGAAGAAAWAIKRKKDAETEQDDDPLADYE
jgi:hypothetical protein